VSAQDASFAAGVDLATAVLGTAACTSCAWSTCDPDPFKPRAVAEVVAVRDEPYGLVAGRRYYDGVDVTLRRAVPAGDVRGCCEGGAATTDCAATVAGCPAEVAGNDVGSPT
jgi:hypothetical protein